MNNAGELWRAMRIYTKANPEADVKAFEAWRVADKGGVGSQARNGDGYLIPYRLRA